MVNLTNIARGEGGAEHQLSLAKYFIKNGHEVGVMTPARGDRENVPEWLDPIVIWSVSVTGLGLPGSLDSILQVPLLIWHRLTGKYNVLYIRATALTVVLTVIARVMLMKVVVEHNGWLSSERIGRGGAQTLAGLEKVLQVWSAQTAHLNRTVTRGLQRLLVEAGVDKSRTIVIGNGTDLNQFHPLQRQAVLDELGWDASIQRIGFIGILVPWQGLETAIRAFAMLESRAGLRLVIAGDGPDMPRLRRLAVELKVDTDIDFLGYVERSKANLVINSFDIAIAPFTRRRNSEIGLSAIKIRDYAAAGRFVICSNIPELLEGEVSEWACLHGPDDPQDLCRLIQDFLRTDQDMERVQKAARAYAERHFDWEVIASRVLSCINGL